MMELCSSFADGASHLGKESDTGLTLVCWAVIGIHMTADATRMLAVKRSRRTL